MLNTRTGIKIIAVFSIIVGMSFLMEQNSALIHLRMFIQQGDLIGLLAVAYNALYVVAGIGLLKSFKWGAPLFVLMSLAYLIGLIVNGFIIHRMHLAGEALTSAPIIVDPKYMALAILFIFSLVYLGMSRKQPA